MDRMGVGAKRQEGHIGTYRAIIKQLYKLMLMESSLWQSGNYSTSSIMLAWHLVCQ